jgi:hypothetical protein
MYRVKGDQSCVVEEEEEEKTKDTGTGMSKSIV